MYKLLLCLRYLRTRYIALASIISVTLGVATMIVVNAVMAGFSHEMQKRIHGILSDVVVESMSSGGFHDPEARMREIESVVGEHVECMTPTVSVPAMLSYRFLGQWITRPVTVVGIPENAPLAGDYAKYLQHPQNRKQPSFQLREGGYDVIDQQAGPDAPRREQLATAGWPYRRWRAERERTWDDIESRQGSNRVMPEEPAGGGFAEPESLVERENPVEAKPSEFVPPEPEADNPFAGQVERTPSRVFDPAKEQEAGCVLGFALATYRDHEGGTHFTCLPGDDVKLTLPNAAIPPRAIDDNFTVVDLYESKMHEYDSNFVFVPLRKLQELRGMVDPQTGIGNVTAIQIKLKNPEDGRLVQEKLQACGLFPQGIYVVSTWRDKQGALLAAVQMETAILNILLFLIIAVAGFGILAIFFMIVVEKTRDIGIMKALGASSTGVLGIFLSYGLSLGLVGAGAGMVGGLLFVTYINEIADFLGWLTGREVFDPTIYYFYTIPAIIDAWTVGWIVVGAVSIAVLASVAPALRAARLHPVEALRYE